QSVAWSKPVFAGDSLYGMAEITSLTDRSPRNGLAQLTLRVFNQHDELVLTGVTECIVKKREISC
ncbi:MAG: MaoC family dehydratase, partial [Oscillospiraceae bacterium]|nr:MaoC family dehydratase [Oscillospiraceae bacterium]